MVLLSVMQIFRQSVALCFQWQNTYLKIVFVESSYEYLSSLALSLQYHPSFGIIMFSDTGHSLSAFHVVQGVGMGAVSKMSFLPLKVFHYNWDQVSCIQRLFIEFRLMNPLHLTYSLLLLLLLLHLNT